MSSTAEDRDKASVHVLDISQEMEHHAMHTGVAGLVPDEDISEAERQHVLHKLDWLLLPLASGCVLLQMLDKTLINYANLMNFRADLGLEKQEYSWLGSIFYFGYLAGTPLHAIALQKFTLSPYISLVVIVWGVVLACHAAALNYGAFLAVRFFLGFFEAAINPGFILLTGRFYTRKEQVIRVAIWYSMNGWAMIVGGAMTYGILIHPAPTLNRWQEMFVGVGVVTVSFGILCLYVSALTQLHYAFLPRDDQISYRARAWRRHPAGRLEQIRYPRHPHQKVPGDRGSERYSTVHFLPCILHCEHHQWWD